MSLSAAYFDDLYAGTADPWGLATRQYEARKYAITLASLPLERYRRIFEPGCSIGVLTRMLATRADTVVATDISEAALATAQQEGVPSNVTLNLAAAPYDWPSGNFDLIVFSELGYYFEQADLDQFVERTLSSLEPHGHLVAVHWRTPVAEYPADAESVHATLAASPLERLARYADNHFLLEIFGQGEAKLIGPNEQPTG
jgi:cyclopropane fatty-acyl-phospholipid synthase-like methyltransferase